MMVALYYGSFNFTLGWTFGLKAFIAAILGGIGYAILGPLSGSLVMTLLPEMMRIAKLIAPIVNGVVLILLVLFLPRGLLSLLEYRVMVEQRIAKLFKRQLT